jgi:peptidyl-prolyl cis-trans isomerase D
MTPELFEAMQLERLKARETRQRLIANVEVSEKDIEKAFREQEEKVNLSFIRLAPALLEEEIQIDEKELNAFFAEKQENFRIPERVSLDYILFDSANYLSATEVTPEDLQKYYQRHLDRFDVQESVRLAHIYFQVPAAADEDARAKVLDRAREVLSQARNNGDFGALAKQYSDDKKSAESGGDLGRFIRGSLNPALEKAAFALNSGEISDVVQSPAGFHIIKALDHTHAHLKPLEEVKAEVEKGARQEKALEIALDKAMAAYNINRKTGSLASAAEANGLEIRSTGLFARGESVPALGDHPEIAGPAFTLDVGKLARPMVLDKRVVLAEVKERQASHLPELAAVRPQVEQAYRREKAAALAVTRAKAMLKELAAGKKLEEVASAYNAAVRETGFFSRTSKPFIPKLGNSEEWFSKVFDLNEAHPFLQEPVSSGDNILVVTLADLQKPDMSRLDEERREKLRETLKNRKEQEAISKKIAELRETAEISYGPIFN